VKNVTCWGASGAERLELNVPNPEPELSSSLSCCSTYSIIILQNFNIRKGIMKLFVITLFATAFLSVDASPKPGGYTLKGGVDHRYMQEKPQGYYRDAQQAGQFAQQQKLNEELNSGSGFGTFNSKRSAPEAPQQVTFFTTHANHAALTSLAQDNASDQQFHTKREVYQKPLYYNEYHNRR
jgi:hypothetical protein